jgi:glucokinase
MFRIIAVFKESVNYISRHAIIAPMKKYIAIDIGGTQIRVAVFPENSVDFEKQKKIPTQGDGKTPIDRLLGLLEEIWPSEGDVQSISMAAPGYLDPEAGIVITAPNIPGWKNLPVSSLIQERFTVPVYLGNDANLAALGEWKFGAGKGHSDLLYLTISTGIGGGIISGNRLITGTRGMAGELGHVVAIPDGPMCACGKKGHIEAVSSGTAIARYVKEKIAEGIPSIFPPGSTPSSKEIASAAAHGDELSIQAFRQAGYYLGQAIADWIHILNPSILILGGGVSRSGDLLMKPLIASLKEHIITEEYIKDLKIEFAALGDDAGLLGALALSLEK